MAKTPKNTEGKTAATVKAEPAVAVSPPAPDAGPSGARTPPANDPAGTSSTDAPRAPKADGGAGDPAGPASPLARSTDELIQEGKAAADQQMGTLADLVEAEAAFVKKHPLIVAAFDAWKGKTPPVAIRITARRDGFRRAGIAHSASPVEHPIEDFLGQSERVEQLLAEPNLIVEFVAAEGDAA